jgi:hypothetical protein
MTIGVLMLGSVLIVGAVLMYNRIVRLEELVRVQDETIQLQNRAILLKNLETQLLHQRYHVQ